jgi:Icc-related predicted phosphoesterase
MNIITISDLHGHLPVIPACDVLLIAGDICPKKDHGLTRQVTWLNSEFRAWLESVPADEIVSIAGNHDFIFEKAPHLVPDLSWTYLQDDGVEIDGLNIWGTPWQPVFGNWAFNATAERLARQWSLIPDDTDILISHCPPYGYGDLAPRKITAENEKEWPSPEHAGCPHLRDRVLALPRLKLHVFGHIHVGRGLYHAVNAKGHAIRLVNAAVVDERYELVHSPFAFDISPTCPDCDGELYTDCLGTTRCEECGPGCPCGCSPGVYPPRDEEGDDEAA